MIRIGLIKEGKTPNDNRVALTPAHCKWIHKNASHVRVIAQSSEVRCFSDKEYLSAGVEVKDELSDCDILLGIKEVPIDQLIDEMEFIGPTGDVASARSHGDGSNARGHAAGDRGRTDVPGQPCSLCARPLGSGR